jgi:hypothetical protein
MCLSVVAGLRSKATARQAASRIKTKTHDCCQPWVLVKISFSTSTNGVADYNDGQNDNL